MMKKISAGLILAAGASATAERYIIHYDNATWQNLRLNSLPDNTVRVIQSLQMTVADLTADEVSMYENVPGITVEKDRVMELFSGVQQNPKTWGLDRIDQRDLPLDQKYRYPNEGEGVDVYVVDSGTHASHQEFGGRAVFERNFVGDRIDDDCGNHGTHVSSTIGGETVGVAKKAKIHGIKVMRCDGTGDLNQILAGVGYVAANQLRNPQQKSIINMSLGGRGQSPTFSAGVKAAVAAGVTVVVAAGNDNQDACNYTPASTPEAITVGATDKNDAHSIWRDQFGIIRGGSNWGKCVDIYAPGTDIYGAWPDAGRSNTNYNTISGTSMASPHVAGVSALILASGKARTPAEVRAALTSGATQDHIKNVPRETPNKLVFVDPSWTTTTTSVPQNGSTRFSFRSINNLDN